MDPQRERLNLRRMPASMLRMNLGDTVTSVRRGLSVYAGVGIVLFAWSLTPALPGKHGLGPVIASACMSGLAIVGWLRAGSVVRWLRGE
jgi:hypothetical protein